jgi:uncharacterized membrane protein
VNARSFLLVVIGVVWASVVLYAAFVQPDRIAFANTITTGAVAMITGLGASAWLERKSRENNDADKDHHDSS